jgi:hypothetical protein
LDLKLVEEAIFMEARGKSKRENREISEIQSLIDDSLSIDDASSSQSFM